MDYLALAVQLTKHEKELHEMQAERDLCDIVKEAKENGRTPSKEYSIVRTPNGVRAGVWLDWGWGKPITTKPLSPRNDLVNHSPDGFEMGYAGSGPAQLALALLADALESDEQAVALHQDFKRETVAHWTTDAVWLTAETIRSIAADLRAKREPWPDPFEETEPSDDPPEGAHVEHCGTMPDDPFADD